MLNYSNHEKSLIERAKIQAALPPEPPNPGKIFFYERVLATWQTTLPTCQRDVVRLWIQRLSYEEIAEALGISDKTVSSHLARAKKRLRKLAERERESFDPEN